MVSTADALRQADYTNRLHTEQSKQEAHASVPSSFRNVLEEKLQPAYSRECSSLSSEPPQSADRDTQLHWAARQLEALFMQELFACMRRTVPEGGLFPQSFSSRTYQELLDTEQSKALTQAGGIGLTEEFLRQMKG